MTHTFRPGTRENTQLIIGSIGASGSGKTYSLFELATGLAYPEASNAEELAAIIQKEGRNRIAVIDTERGRALHYAPPPGQRADPWADSATFAFDHMAMEPPFSPQAYQEAAESADDAGYTVVIIDSGSHEWAGEGGVLEWQETEMQEAAERRAKRYNRQVGFQDLEAVKMQSWIKPKMAHKKLVGRLTTLRAHLLIALRGEQKVHMGKDPNDPKKTVVITPADLPPNKRWSPVCEKDFPYELTMSFVLSPEEPGVPIPLKLQKQHRPFIPLDRPISIETGRALAGWAGGSTAKTSPASTGQQTRSAGGKRTPEQLTGDFEETVRACNYVQELKDLWDRAAKFREGLEARGNDQLLRRCQDAYDLRLDELSRQSAGNE